MQGKAKVSLTFGLYEGGQLVRRETVTQNQISMCGMLPAVIVLETLRLLGDERQAERVAYATTADVTGDTSRVVGYAGIVVS